MDTNDLIEELLMDVPNGAELLLAKTPSGQYVFIWSINRNHSMRVLKAYEGEALALVYPADVNQLNPLSYAQVQSAFRVRLIDAVLGELI